MTREEEERYAQEEVDEQRYAFVRDVVAAEGFKVAFNSISLGFTAGIYMVGAEYLESIVGRLTRDVPWELLVRESLNVVVPDEELQAREVWIMTPFVHAYAREHENAVNLAILNAALSFQGL